MVIVVPGIIQPSVSVIFLIKWGCIGHWGHGGCWGCRGHWGSRGSKAWKITSENIKVIQVDEFSFIWMFWKQLFLGRIMKYQDEFLAPFLSEAVEASIFYFCWNWLMKLKCQNLLKPLGILIRQISQFYYPLESFSFHHFTRRHLVVGCNIFSICLLEKKITKNMAIYGFHSENNFWKIFHTKYLRFWTICSVIKVAIDTEKRTCVN